VSGSLPTVLVVDDNMANISVLAHVLDSEYDVVFANNGREALELARSAQPDLILLDIVMPDMDGYEVCAQLKRDAATADIPVIFISGLDDHDAESRGIELGALDYITKPFSVGIVRARVRNHVELKRARDRLRSLAATDGLTGLANRRRLDEALHAECKRLARTQSQLGLIMLDIDHFKAFNDTYGHIAGDDCLRNVASTLSAAMIRGHDLAARYGGEEFACILPETTLPGTAAVAERIQADIQGLAIAHEASKVAHIITGSFGVVSIKCDAATVPGDVLRAADACLYRAKAQGRNRIVAVSA
jgi:diguanylate cyclase (GGDEF)-like protein